MRLFRHHDLVSLCLLTLSLLVLNVYSTGVSFTTPGAGATWPAGKITISWTDAGGNPDMSQLSTYVLQLIVGGNQADDSTAIATIGSPGAHVSDGNVEDEIAADIAQSIENGFYFKMTSNTTDGNSQVINYSERFTLINMNGSTEESYLNGANSAQGASDVPEAQLNNNVNPTPSASPSSTANPSATTTATATATASPPPGGAGGKNDGMSIGEKAAIGVGALLAIIGIASLFGWAYVFYRHKKRKQQIQRYSQQKPPSSSARASKIGRAGFIDDKAELPGRPTSGMPAGLQIPRELSPQNERMELPDFGKPVEAARASIYELEGDIALCEAGNGRKSKAYDPLDM